MEPLSTKQEFEQVLGKCRELYRKKLQDYGCSWRIMRPSSITDQLYIKARRIRTLENGEAALIAEGIPSELMALVNYSIIGLIQLKLGPAEQADLDNETALALYDEFAASALELMLHKNHDYGEAWRGMRPSSYTDLILMKIFRTKQIENNAGRTLISEGVDANYMDIMNYAVFGLIKADLENV